MYKYLFSTSFAAIVALLLAFSHYCESDFERVFDSLKNKRVLSTAMSSNTISRNVVNSVLAIEQEEVSCRR